MGDVIKKKEWDASNTELIYDNLYELAEYVFFLKLRFGVYLLLTEPKTRKIIIEKALQQERKNRTSIPRTFTLFTPKTSIVVPYVENTRSPSKTTPPEKVGCSNCGNWWGRGKSRQHRKKKKDIKGRKTRKVTK
jgi:hypothetical protein